MGTSKAGITRWKSRERIQACKDWISARSLEGFNPSIADIRAAGHSKHISILARGELISDGILPGKPTNVATKDMRPCAGPEKEGRKSTVRGASSPSALPPTPNPEAVLVARKAKPKESIAAYLARLQRQIDANAAANCERTQDPKRFEPARQVKPSGWMTRDERNKAKAKFHQNLERYEREFGGIQCDLGIIERG